MKKQDDLIYDAGVKIGLAMSLFEVLSEFLDLDINKPSKETVFEFTHSHARLTDLATVICDYMAQANNLLNELELEG